MTHPFPTHLARLALAALVLALLGGALAQDGDGADGPESIAAAIANHPQLTTLAELLDGTGMMLQLQIPARLTVFAPSDRAFERAGLENVQEMLRNRGPLDTVLRHHMVWGSAPPDALRRMDALTTVEGTRLAVTRAGDAVQVDGAPIRDGVRAGEAMLYVVDRLLLPEASVMVKDLLSGPPAR